MIPPDKFVPLAEETGLILELGNWILDEACRQIRIWLDAGLEPIPIAVNISARQFDNQLPERLQLMIERYRLPCELLKPVSYTHLDVYKRQASRSLSLKLLQLVATDADTCEIEAIFRQDPVLAYHLLRLVNSLGVGVGRTISSFAQAILILGRQQLKRWLNLMLFAASRDDYRSAMLLARVAVRARTMELLAKARGFDRSEQDQAFMAGMFSLLGILFGLPLAGILNPLQLHESLTSGVLHHEGELGRLLQAVECSECADETRLIGLLGSLNLSIACLLYTSRCV